MRRLVNKRSLCLVGLSWLVLFSCRGSSPPWESVMIESAEARPHASSLLQVSLSQKGTSLHWTVRNSSSEPVWAFLLVPSILHGEWSFAVDTAWSSAERDLLILRKIDTPVPNRVKAERVSSGAVKLGPGESREGNIQLGDEVTLSDPYGAHSGRHKVTRVVLEVGSLPVRKDQGTRQLTFDGKPFAYLRTEMEPGGQQFSRSPVLTWTPTTQSHWAD